MKIRVWFLLALCAALLMLPSVCALAEDGASLTTQAPAATAEEPAVLEETGDQPDAIAIDMPEQPLTLGESLLYMLKGMTGIFLVTALIILVLKALERLTKEREQKE